MRKLCYFLLGAAGLLMASCSQEDLESPAVKGDGNYNVRVTLPGDMLTRSLGDGLTANKLLVAVYDADNNDAPVFQDITTYSFQAGQLTTTVSMNLVNGKTYDIAFFALSFEAFNQAIYNFDMGNGTITVNYENMTSDANIADSYDCFFKLHNTGKISEDSMDVDVTLTRPMSQINWGTDDLSQPAIYNNYGPNGEYIETTLTTEAYNVFDMLTGTTTGDKVDVTLANWAAPIAETFPVSPYRYVAMAYLLAPATSDVYDLSLNITNDLNTNVAVHSSNTIEVGAAPVQANYRTNIYGTLLSDVVTFNVNKDPTWGDPDYNVGLSWDGTTKTYPTVSADGNTYSVNKASDLAGLADMINGENGQTKTSFEGKTIVLAYDFDMNGNTFPGLGAAKRSSATATGNSFQGVFDGNNHTIKNMKIASSGDEDAAVGFIGNLDGTNAQLKDITFENVNISDPDSEQVAIVGLVTNGATVSNVTVSSGTITGKSAGGIVGRMIKYGTIEECNNNATIVSTGSNTGGIVGSAYYTTTDQYMYITDCTNTGNVTGGTNMIGGIAGLCAAEVTGCTNEGTVSGSNGSTGIGGIVGGQAAAGSVENCINRGTVTTGSYVGGIVGWLTYYTGGSYTRNNVISLIGNKNYGNISGSGSVAGILGMTQNSGFLTNNSNYAAKITANSNAAGIVGSASKASNPAVGDGNLVLSGNTSTTSIDDITGNPKNEIYNGTVVLN